MGKKSFITSESVDVINGLLNYISMSKYIPLLIISFLFGCSNSDNPNIIIHPTEENLNPEFGITNTIRDSDVHYSDNTIIEKFITRLVNHEPFLTIGKSEGAPYEMLGNVKDVLIDKNENIMYVLDAQNIGVQAYDMRGNYLYDITREGRGPGELSNPGSMKLAGDLAFVSNGMYGIQTYFRKDGRFEHEELIIPGMHHWDICIKKDEIFSSVTPDMMENDDVSHSIFKYRLDDYDKPLNRFGVVYKSDLPRISFSFTAGARLACHSSISTIVQHFRIRNLLYGYNDEGKLEWITRLEDFTHMAIIEERSGNQRMGPDPDNPQSDYDIIETAIATEEGLILVQVINKSITDRDDIIKTYLINANDGSGFFVGDELPKILSVNDNKIVFLKYDEYPMIEISNF